MRQAVHRTIADVTRDLERWSYNTAVAHCMELLNLGCQTTYGRGERHGDGAARAATCGTRRSTRCLALLAPYVPARDRRALGAPPPRRASVHLQRWPTFDPELVRQDTVTMVVQVNGKVRDRIDVDAGISEGDAEAAALASPGGLTHREGGRPTAWSGRRASRRRRLAATTRRRGMPSPEPGPAAPGPSVVGLVEARQHVLPHRRARPCRARRS